MTRTFTVIVKGSDPATGAAFARLWGLEPELAETYQYILSDAYIRVVVRGTRDAMAAWFGAANQPAPFPAGTCLWFREHETDSSPQG